MELVRRLNELTGTDLALRQYLATMESLDGDRMPIEFVPRLIAEIDTLVAAAYTEPELEAIIAWEESEIGRKVRAKSPEIMRAAMEIGAKLGGGL